MQSTLDFCYNFTSYFLNQASEYYTSSENKFLSKVWRQFAHFHSLVGNNKVANFIKIYEVQRISSISASP